VISDTEYTLFVPGEKRNLLAEVDPGDPTALTATHIKASDQTNDRSAVEQQPTPSKPSSGYMEPLC